MVTSVVPAVQWLRPRSASNSRENVRGLSRAGPRTTGFDRHGRTREPMGEGRPEHKQAPGMDPRLGRGADGPVDGGGVERSAGGRGDAAIRHSGALDLSFGTDGVTTISWGLDLVAVTRAIVQPDGKILVGSDQPGVGASVTVVRLLPTGHSTRPSEAAAGTSAPRSTPESPRTAPSSPSSPTGRSSSRAASRSATRSPFSACSRTACPDNTFGTASVTRPHYFDSSNSGLVREPASSSSPTARSS